MTCTHSFPTTPPRGTMEQPGDCRTCGTSYQNAKQERAAAEETGTEAWRTDPRERLLAAIDRTWARGELGATPEQLVDAYAHHLAEQLRTASGSYGSPNYDYELGPGLGRAADLIDPEVKP